MYKAARPPKNELLVATSMAASGDTSTAFHHSNSNLSSQIVLPQISMQPMQTSAEYSAGETIPDAPVIADSKETQIDILNGDPKSEVEKSAGDLEVDYSNFDWKWLCMPRLPWSKDTRLPAFYGIHDKIPIAVALVMGFQHALAMMGGIITPPILVSGAFYARFTNEETQYLLSVGLICSGILSFTQIIQLKLWGGFVIGTGFISVVGTSFVFLPIAQASIVFQMTQDSSRSCSTDADCTMAWAGQTGPLAGVAIPGVTNVNQCNTATQKCRFR
jgi:hypothetical protein